MIYGVSLHSVRRSVSRAEPWYGIVEATAHVSSTPIVTPGQVTVAAMPEALDIRPGDTASAALARSITRSASKQTYYTGRLLVDPELIDDFLRAYAYFRWVDDIVDESPLSPAECLSFMGRQRRLIDRLYLGERPAGLAEEEKIVADLVRHDTGDSSGLQSFIRNMLAVIDFDAGRKGRLITQRELTWYSMTLATSVTDGLQYFIGHGHPYPKGDDRYSAAFGAHIAHLLRDMVVDTANGFINIPSEYLEEHGIGPEDAGSPLFRDWVSDRVSEAREHLTAGRQYLDTLDVLRCKTAGYWYCARFEVVLDTIERDDYALRETYGERRRLSTWLKIASLGASVSLRHFGRSSTDTRDE